MNAFYLQIDQTGKAFEEVQKTWSQSSSSAWIPGKASEVLFTIFWSLDEHMDGIRIDEFKWVLIKIIVF